MPRGINTTHFHYVIYELANPLVPLYFMTAQEIMKKYDISRGTFYKCLTKECVPYKHRNLIKSFHRQSIPRYEMVLIEDMVLKPTPTHLLSTDQVVVGC